MILLKLDQLTDVASFAQEHQESFVILVQPDRMEGFHVAPDAFDRLRAWVRELQ